MSLTLLETEKSYLLQGGNFFTVTCKSKMNKIELAKLIKQAGLSPIKINSIQPFYKKKQRANGRNKPNTVMVKRPKKFIIKLKTGEVLTKNSVDSINKKLA